MPSLLRTHIAFTFLSAIVSLSHTQIPIEIGYPDTRISSRNATVSQFSCAGGPQFCPDQGEYVAAGGNLTLSILAIRNLRNYDHLSKFSLQTDAYMQANIGNTTRVSDVIPNSLNPEWPPCSEEGCRGKHDIRRDLNFGFRRSGSEISVQIMDQDSGFEFGDDLIANVSLNVIYCSAFTSRPQIIRNLEDSVWKMETQPLCVEQAWIPLLESALPGDCYDTDSGKVADDIPCLLLRMTVLPFQMRVDEIYIQNASLLGGMAGYFPAHDTGNADVDMLYGRIYTKDITRLASYFRMTRSKGGLLVRPQNELRNAKGNYSFIEKFQFAPYARIAINYPAEMFVFRLVKDSAIVPEWLDVSFGWTLTREYAQILNAVGDYRAFAQNRSAVHINKYQDSMEKSIVIGMNVPRDENKSTLAMYFIILQPTEAYDVVPKKFNIIFTRIKFLTLFAQFFPTVAALTTMALLYLKRLNWRIERVPSELARQILETESLLELSSRKRPAILIQMLLPSTLEYSNFQTRLMYATTAVYLCIFSPFLVLLAWGLTAILVVTPSAIGFAIIFLSPAFLVALYALLRWRHMKWRMTKQTRQAFLTSLTLVFLFLFSATFADPKVFIGGENLDFYALTSIFMTLNMMPMIWLAFTNDRQMRKSLSQVFAVVGASKKMAAVREKFKRFGATGIKWKDLQSQLKSRSSVPNASLKGQEQRDLKETVCTSLLGNYYSVDIRIPGLKYADVLESPFVIPRREKRAKMNRRVYGYAVFLLVAYSIVAAISTSYGVYAIGNSVTIAFTDFCIFLLSRGDTSWSAGYATQLLTAFRVSLIITCGKYWMLGQSLVYIVFGMALIRDVINRNLPRMSEKEASKVAVFGSSLQQQHWRYSDLSTRPEFALGLLCFCYVFVLVAAGFKKSSTHVDVLKQKWPMWTFGVLALAFVLFTGLLLATARAYYLQKGRLLSKMASEMYFIYKGWSIPYILAACTEILLICCGLFLYAATDSSFIVELSVFGPLLLLTFLPVYAHWCRNDYQLIIWPPQDSDEDQQDDDDKFCTELEREADLLFQKSKLMPSFESDELYTLKLPPKNASANDTAIKAKVKREKKKAPWISDKLALLFGGNRLAKIKRDRKLRRLQLPSRPSPAIPGIPNLRTNGGESSAAENAFLSSYDAVEYDKITIVQAFRTGYLLPKEYAMIACAAAHLFLAWLFGMLVTASESPAWIGQVLWTMYYVTIFTVLPILKYFRIGNVWTRDIKVSLACSLVFAWFVGILFFVITLECSLNEIGTLITFSILIFIPNFLLLFLIIDRWRNENFQFSRIIKVTMTACCLMLCLFILEMYVFVSIEFGVFLTIVAILILFLAYFMLQWLRNDRYLAPKKRRQARLLLCSASVLSTAIGFLCGLDVFLCLTIAFFSLIIWHGISFAAAYWILFVKNEVELYHSPYVFPVFVYGAFQNKVVSKSDAYRSLYMVFFLLFSWGVAGVLFVQPIGFGISVCSFVLLAFASLSAHFCASTPLQMGTVVKFVKESILSDASTLSIKAFDEERKPFSLISKEFAEFDELQAKEERAYQEIAFGKSMTPKTLQVFDELDTDVSRKSCKELAIEIHTLEVSCGVKYSRNVKYKANSIGVLGIKDLWNHSYELGKGPFGYIHGLKLVYRGFKWIQSHYIPDCPQSWRRREKGPVNSVDHTESLKRFKDAISEIDKADEYDSIPQIAQATSSDETLFKLCEICKLDERLSSQYAQEVKCLVHFQLLMMNAVDARLAHEKLLFQKFLRTNRLKLISNDMNPPPDIFRSSSSASIDLPLVAVWLQSLPEEQQARFHSLKENFNQEREKLDALVDAEDKQKIDHQLAIREYWKPYEEAQSHNRMQEFYARRERRNREGYYKNRQATEIDEAVLNAQEAIAEIESGYSCALGDCGRALQFVDQQFPPDYSSIQCCTHLNEIAGWKISLGINVTCGLFDNGTDPDDICMGRLSDAWLLSAISIIAASGGVGDGKVDALIENLFLTKEMSKVGAFAMRIYKNCQWETVIVDDYFPILRDSSNYSVCADAAFAHSPGFKELWVPLLEKAFAKYHGGYSALEYGYVHHALTELTGYPSEEILLAPASRGNLKKTLWNQMLNFKENKFLLGAGTIDSKFADMEFLDAGLVFGSCYVIYDIRMLDNHRLILLRNPPGSHPEWKGDWSDTSRFWTRRLRTLLHWNPDVEDSTFWMSFDDFCHAFRSLYVCKYYDPEKWPTSYLYGQWKCEETAWGLPTRYNMDCKLENNPQYSLVLHRPTRVNIVVTQVEFSGLAAINVQPMAVFVAKSSGGDKAKTFFDRAMRVVALNKDNVVAYSGEAKREREIHISCDLDPQPYTILVVTYKKDMEGYFRIAVQTNYLVLFTQLWPMLGKDSSPTTLTEQMFTKVKENVMESSAFSAVREKKDELLHKLTLATDVVQKDRVASTRASIAKHSAPAVVTKVEKKSVWIERWDQSTGKPFYYNRETGISTWDRPSDI